jgi:hypothetical protein
MCPGCNGFNLKGIVFSLQDFSNGEGCGRGGRFNFTVHKDEPHKPLESSSLNSARISPINSLPFSYFACSAQQNQNENEEDKSKCEGKPYRRKLIFSRR